MRRRTKLPCRHRGCAALVDKPGYCEAHAHEAPRSIADRKRGSSTKRGYGYRWQKFRESYLSSHPLCVECEKAGKITPATDVDHIVPHRGDMEKFWQGPFQALCGPCHKSKTAKGL